MGENCIGCWFSGPKACIHLHFLNLIIHNCQIVEESVKNSRLYPKDGVLAYKVALIKIKATLEARLN